MAMSIVTKTGDDGTTGLLYNRRVSKADSRVEACGAVDELNAAIGLARASAVSDIVRETLLPIQKQLVILMGEVATLPDDMARYLKDGFKQVTPEMTAQLDLAVKQIEARQVRYDDWATPGGTLPAAALDVARTVCRRAERRICGLKAVKALENPEIGIYLNRLSDLLWLFARWEETKSFESGSGSRGSGAI
jgi:cob(I)alamin adenosyltransferase